MITWEHLIESTFQSMAYGSQSSLSKLKIELISQLRLVKSEIALNSNFYSDVLPVTFESKVRLVLSILKVIKIKIRKFFFYKN